MALNVKSIKKAQTDFDLLKCVKFLELLGNYNNLLYFAKLSDFIFPKLKFKIIKYR
jgi:hypothetical protein